MLRSLVAATVCTVCFGNVCSAQVTAERVRTAIDRGVDYLKRQIKSDGSWPTPTTSYQGGTTALALLALLECGIAPEDPIIQRGLRNLRAIKPDSRESRTYVVALQTMVYSLADPEKDRGNIKANVTWLENAQVKAGPNAGTWGYALTASAGDNSNTQYALLGLHAASEVGEKIDPEVWRRSYDHFKNTQNADGSWGYNYMGGPRGSMTVAGIASLIICGERLHVSKERIVNGQIENCGEWEKNEPIFRAIQWLARYPTRTFLTNPELGSWQFYYLYGLERAGRLTGQRFFDALSPQGKVVRRHDWYRDGAQMLVGDFTKEQLAQKPEGLWEGGGAERSAVISTSFALLFLAKGRSPVIVNKLRHDCSDPFNHHDWNNDRNDVRHLTEYVSKYWKRRMTWQIVDARTASVEELLQAPIIFLNGHLAPVFTEQEKQRLTEFVEQGGFIFAEACCSRPEFDRGIRDLFAEIFPDNPLKVLSDDHPIWKADYVVPGDGSLEGIEFGCRTSVVYSRIDLSCYWEQKELAESSRALMIGSNVLAYATGKELLPDKLASRKVIQLRDAGASARWMMRVGKLKHGGDWNVAPMAVPNLLASLRDNQDMKVVLQQFEVSPLDKNLMRTPFVYMHGRAQFSFDDEQLEKLKMHLESRGTLFADACCGSEAFDAAFRDMIRRLLPGKTLEPIPVTDDLFGENIGQGEAIREVEFTKSMPRRRGPPLLEGVKLDNRWAVVYSKYDIGCALERHQGVDCKGYTHQSAVRIATNVLLYALLH